MESEAEDVASLADPRNISALSPAAAGEPVTRIRLLLVTLRLLADEGYDNLSLRKVAAEAQTATSSIYHFFGGKEAMCRAAIEFAAAEILHNEATIVGQGPPIERLRQALGWMGATSSTGLRRDFALAAGELRSATDATVPDVMSEQLGPMRMVMDPVFDAVADGSLRIPEGYTADEVGKMLLACIIGIARFTEHDEFSHGDRIAALFVDAVLEALGAD